jgi:hypothetical protein
MAESISMKLCIYVIALEPISTPYFINPSHQSVCLYAYPLIVARPWLGRKITTAAIEEFLGASFSMGPVMYQSRPLVRLRASGSM